MGVKTKCFLVHRAKERFYNSFGKTPVLNFVTSALGCIRPNKRNPIIQSNALFAGFKVLSVTQGRGGGVGNRNTVGRKCEEQGQ